MISLFLAHNATHMNRIYLCSDYYLEADIIGYVFPLGIAWNQVVGVVPRTPAYHFKVQGHQGRVGYR